MHWQSLLWRCSPPDGSSLPLSVRRSFGIALCCRQAVVTTSLHFSQGNDHEWRDITLQTGGPRCAPVPLYPRPIVSPSHFGITRHNDSEHTWSIQSLLMREREREREEGGGGGGNLRGLYPRQVLYKPSLLGAKNEKTKHILICEVTVFCIL